MSNRNGRLWNVIVRHYCELGLFIVSGNRAGAPTSTNQGSERDQRTSRQHWWWFRTAALLVSINHTLLRHHYHCSCKHSFAVIASWTYNTLHMSWDTAFLLVWCKIGAKILFHPPATNEVGFADIANGIYICTVPKLNPCSALRKPAASKYLTKFPGLKLVISRFIIL